MQPERVYPSHPGDRLRDDSRTLGLNPLLLGKGLATASRPLLFRVRRASNVRRRTCMHVPQRCVLRTRACERFHQMCSNTNECERSRCSNRIYAYVKHTCAATYITSIRVSFRCTFKAIVIINPYPAHINRVKMFN